MIHPKNLDQILFVLYIVFFVSILGCFRAVTSIIIPVILVLGIYKNKIEQGRFFNAHWKNYFFLSCCVYYVIQLSVLLMAQHDPGKLILLKSAVVFVPAMICCSNYPGANNYRKLLTYYTWIVAIAMLYCLGMAVYKYFFISPDIKVFFYHALVIPLKQHAIQVSILVFIAIIYLLEAARKASFMLNKQVHFLFIFYFTCCTVLLSSKLVIACTLICLLYYLFLFFKTAIKTRVLSMVVLIVSLALVSVVLFTHNQVSKRFNEIIETNMDLVSQRQYNPGIYFNGLQFRLLQWRFTKEILTEKKAWFTGVANQSQNLLDQKYISSHMYTGDGRSVSSQGYLGYNTHNQFLESLLQAGILGLLSYLMVFLSLLFLAVRGKRIVLSFVVSLLLAYSLNESVLERQYSIVIFTFFPLLFYYGGRVKVRSSGR